MVSRRRRPSGFTLVELLVVITILGMLMAMIFPAMGGIFETVRKTQCANNLSNAMGKAIAQYTTGPEKCYPGLVEQGTKSAKYPRGRPMTWATALLGGIGEKSLYESWYRPATGAAEMQVGKVKSYICPSDTLDDRSDQQLSYVINAGAIEDGRDPALAGGQSALSQALTTRINSNGISFNRYSAMPDSVSPKVSPQMVQKNKGLNYQFLISENIQAWNWGDKRTNDSDRPNFYDGDRATSKKNMSAAETQMYTGFVWNGYNINMAGENEDPLRDLQAKDPKWARPSSNHQDGVNVLTADGATKYIHNRIQYHVYQALCMTDPKRAVGGNIDPKTKAYTISDEDFAVGITSRRGDGFVGWFERK